MEVPLGPAILCSFGNAALGSFVAGGELPRRPSSDNCRSMVLDIGFPGLDMSESRNGRSVSDWRRSRKTLRGIAFRGDGTRVTERPRNEERSSEANPDWSVARWSAHTRDAIFRIGIGPPRAEYSRGNKHHVDHPTGPINEFCWHRMRPGHSRGGVVAIYFRCPTAMDGRGSTGTVSVDIRCHGKRCRWLRSNFARFDHAIGLGILRGRPTGGASRGEVSRRER